MRQKTGCDRFLFGAVGKKKNWGEREREREKKRDMRASHFMKEEGEVLNFIN